MIQKSSYENNEERRKNNKIQLMGQMYCENVVRLLSDENESINKICTQSQIQLYWHKKRQKILVFGQLAFLNKPERLQNLEELRLLLL